MLGEVDCGFVIWVKSKRYNISIDDQINVSVNNLFTFVDNIIATTNYTNKDIIICGSILPTIKDNTDKKFLKLFLLDTLKFSFLCNIFNKVIEAHLFIHIIHIFFLHLYTLFL